MLNEFLKNYDTASKKAAALLADKEALDTFVAEVEERVFDIVEAGLALAELVIDTLLPEEDEVLNFKTIWGLNTQ